MLISLSIRNIALMDEMQAEFTSGLHVLTGETGAGKSILVDAVVLLLGGRAQKELIRTGETKARVEGVFDLSDCPAALQMLREQELDDGDSLILCREIDPLFETPAAENLIFQNLYAVLLGAPFLLVLGLIAQNQPATTWLVFGILAVYFLVLCGVLFGKLLFGKKKAE